MPSHSLRRYGKNQSQNRPRNEKAKTHNHMHHQMKRWDIPEKNIHNHIAEYHHDGGHFDALVLHADVYLDDRGTYQQVFRACL